MTNTDTGSTNIVWAECDHVPRISPGQIHVFRVDLLAHADLELRARAALSADELERCDRFKFPHLRRRYAIGRAALRTVLGAALGREPGSLRFAYGPQGKPALAEPRAALSFNVSHSEDLALIAVGACEDLGVDLEHRDPSRGCRAIAKRFFAPEEVDALDLMPAHDYLEGFYRCWTRKEAYIKARGGGLTIPLTSFVVSLDAEPRLLRTDTGDATEWSLFAAHPADGFEACVAARGAEGVSWWHWTEHRPN
jgi:4'-phosphopantetheinyl transferase